VLVQQGLDHTSVTTTEGYIRSARIENPNHVNLIDAQMRRAHASAGADRSP
jgi:hypothetical protein